MLGSAGLMKQNIEKRLMASEYFESGLERLRQCEPAAAALGSPIRASSPDIGDNRNNYCDGLRAKFTVPVTGTKRRGLYTFEASRASHQEPWSINSAELVVDDRKLVIRSPPTAEADP